MFLTYDSGKPDSEIHLLSLGLTGTPRSDVALALDTLDALHSGWNIHFNKLNIPSEPVKIRAWAYNSTDTKLYEIAPSRDEGFASK